MFTTYIQRAVTVLVAALLGCVCVSARSYYGSLHTFSQPNGDSVSVRLYGDDYLIHAESLDGYTLIQDPDDGYICYALVSADSSNYTSTGIWYRGGVAPKAVTMVANPHLRISSDAIALKIASVKAQLGFQDEVADNLATKKYAPNVLRAARTTLPDTIYGLTVLIDFPDCKFPFSRAELDKFLNGEGSINGNSRSIKEYFQWISNGKLTYINYLPKEPHTTPNNKDYYAPEDATTYTSNRLIPEVNEAINNLSKEKDGFDLSSLSRKSSVLYAVNILYAGACPNKWATGLWPHQGTMTMKVLKEQILGYNIYTEWAQPYQMSYCSSNLNMGSFIHENLHMLLDAPDFYPFDGHTGNTAQPFNVADEFNSSNIKDTPFPNPYIMELAGWLNNKVVLNDLEDGTKVNLEYGPGNVAVYYGNLYGKPENELYYLEVRSYYYYNSRKINTPGIYIWHVYEPGNNRYKQYSDQLDCRPASSTNPFWSSASPSKVFSDATTPSAKWTNGDDSGLYLCNFSKAGTQMSFCYGNCVEGAVEEEEGGEVAVDTTGGQVADTVVYDKYVSLNLTNRDSLPSGVVGREYYAKLNPIGGDGNYSIKWKDGLPAGLSLNSDFEIVGVPTVTCKKYLKLLVCDGKGDQTEVWLSLKIVEDSTPTDAVLVEGRSVKVVYENGAFTISASGHAACRIYRVDGIKMDEFVLENGENHVFVSDGATGFYIIEVNGKRFKIVKV